MAEEAQASQAALLKLIDQAAAESWKELDLSGMGLTALPVEIGRLTELETLILGKWDEEEFKDVSNPITALPTEISQLQELITLDLRSTDVSELPESVGQLSSLQTLDLSHTGLSELPESVGQLISLQTLDLRSTGLSELPESMGQLSSLQTLDLSYTDVSELPESVCQLISLQNLDFRGSKGLRELPESVGQLINLQSLGLSFTSLKELPESVWQLTNLQSLYLSGTSLRELPESVWQLTNLQSLNLSQTSLRALPESVWQLTNLQSLYLNDTELRELSESVSQLTNLQGLYLSGTSLRELPESVSQLTNLQSLYLSGTSLRELPESVWQLTNLQSLYLNRTSLRELPESVFRLTNLQSLSLSQSALRELPEGVGQLTNLQSLRLDYTMLKELPESVGQLSSLQTLDLRRTYLSELPESVGQLSSLQTLNLSSCHFSQLPSWLRTWETPPSIDLRGNPLPIPESLLGPKESWQNPGDLQAVLNFYFQSQDPEAQPLYEAKLLIVGEGEAGKTTLAKKLQDPDYELKLPGSDHPEKSTEGIDIIEWEFGQQGATPFRVNVWDFGGQEIYHATHQFFLTNRSLYALVVDNRRENPNFYYWLNVVRLLSENSPVFIVKNEKRDRQCEIDEGQLRKEFSNLINETVRVNFLDNRGLDGLKATIQKHITTLPELQTHWPFKWLKVRYALENYATNYIRLPEYLELCKRNGIADKTEALQVSSLLHELGICLHFQRQLGLRDYLILSPTWVTNAIYKVTDDPKVQGDMGRFCRDDLDKIWSDGEYSDLRDELLSLMQMKNFGICYPLKERPDSYLVPSLLSPERPDYAWDDRQNLILRYDYEFMPKGIITRLIVELHKYIEPSDRLPGLVWKAGVILRDGDARGEIIESYGKSEISIRVVGTRRKRLLDVIRWELRQIHESYPSLDYQELIPCNCERCEGSQSPNSYSLSDLEDRLDNRVYEVECRKNGYKKIRVQRLISDITDEVLGEDFSGRAPNAVGRSRFNQDNRGPGHSFQSDISGGNVYQANEITINNYPEPQNNDELAKAIQNLLEQLSESHETKTSAQKGELVDIALVEIETKKPALKRMLSALDSGAMAAISQALNHPAAAFFIAAIEDWNQPQA